MANSKKGKGMLLSLFLLVVGFVMLVKGADYLVDGASAVAKRMCIPPIIIGLTIVAMGTSAPEAAVSISSALHGSNAIAIGNIIGSNIVNIFLILGLCAMITKLSVQRNTVRYEMPFVIFITVLLCAMGWYGEISRMGAGVFLGLFMAFLGYLYLISRHNECDVQNIKVISPLKSIAYIALGLAALVLGSNVAVSAACDIARIIGVSERIIGLTIVAIGTSLPELVTSIIAAKKGEADIAIGNIVGSNIFNILFVLGISGMILPIPFDSAFMIDGAIAILAAVLLWLFTFKNKTLTFMPGLIMVAAYIAYLAYIIAHI